MTGTANFEHGACPAWMAGIEWVTLEIRKPI